MAVHLSSIDYVHGEPCRVGDLDDLGEPVAADLLAEVGTFRASDHDVWELAATAAGQTVKRSSVTPDLMIYVTESDPDPAQSLARIAGRLGLSTVEFLTISGHECGNLGPAVRVAADALHSRRHDAVLLVVADRAETARRVMRNGLSVFSDGAASCIVTRDALDDGRGVRVDAIATRTEVPADSGAFVAADSGIMSVVRLAAASVADVLGADGAGHVDHVVFANYRHTAQRFLLAATRFPAEKLLVGPVSDYGHCYSADLLVTVDRFLADGTLGDGARLLAVSLGPYSWSTMALTCTQPEIGGAPR